MGPVPQAHPLSPKKRPGVLLVSLWGLYLFECPGLESLVFGGEAYSPGGEEGPWVPMPLPLVPGQLLLPARSWGTWRSRLSWLSC